MDEPRLVYSEHATDRNGVPYVELQTDEDDDMWMPMSEGYSVRFYPKTVCVVLIVGGDDGGDPWIHQRPVWRGPREEFDWPTLWERLSGDDDYGTAANDAAEMSGLNAAGYP